jgi:GLPGLI family protein
MKNILVFISICFFPYNISAQPVHPFPRDISNMITVDSVNIRVWYALNAIDINRPDTYDDLQCLEIGAHLSKYYSYFVYNSDSLCTDWTQKHKGAQSSPIRMGASGKKPDEWSEYHYSEYFKDFSNNTFTEYIRMPMYMHKFNCQYSEKIPSQKWEIQGDTLTVCGYLCQKAVCRFRGRDFIAWFTPTIPINNGPWKFGGLPGLILKVCDKDGLYIFECTKIENYKGKCPIKTVDYKSYMKIERKKLSKLLKDIHEDYFKVAGLIRIGGSSIPKPLLYQPLELE